MVAKVEQNRNFQYEAKKTISRLVARAIDYLFFLLALLRQSINHFQAFSFHSSEILTPLDKV